MPATSTTARVYLACLSCYNDGTLTGFWADLDDGFEALVKARDAMFERCNGKPENVGYGPHEEWAIHDSEIPGGSISESEDLELLCGIQELADDNHGDVAWEAWANDRGYLNDVDTLRDYMESAYAGEWPDAKSFVIESFTEQNDIPSHLEYYIDWESMTKDWLINDISTIDLPCGNVAIFNKNF